MTLWIFLLFIEKSPTSSFKDVSWDPNVEKWKVFNRNDEEIYFENQIPNCEVMLGKHDLYPKLGGARLPNANKYEELDLIRWILLLSNGNKSLAEISHKLNVDVEVLFSISKKLESKKILVQK